MRPALARGLYVITDEVLLAGDRLRTGVLSALEGGARTVQYRNKTGDTARRLDEARIIRSLCHRHGAVFIVNDDLPLALEVGADGVHIGRDDVGCKDVRKQAVRDLLVGVSCYDSLQRAIDAQSDGADYVAFGSAFPSPTKPDAVHAPLSLYRDAVGRLDVPVVAIGGITAANAGPLIEAGCHALAVISGVFAADDIKTAAGAFAALFRQRTPR